MRIDFRVAVGAGQAGEVPARLYEAAGDPLAWFVLAPGAGAGHDHRFMVSFGQGLASRGLHLVTFNFPYVERGRRVPDPNATLEACWKDVLRAVGEKAGAEASVFAGGKSMGGRIASQVAAHEPPSASFTPRVSGLVFLSYPLHPPGRPDQRRTAHWPEVRVPALFVQGSRDPFATAGELREELPRFGAATRLLIVDGGDHALEVPPQAGRSRDEVHARVQDEIVAWVREQQEAAGRI